MGNGGTVLVSVTEDQSIQNRNTLSKATGHSIPGRLGAGATMKPQNHRLILATVAAFVVTCLGWTAGRNLAEPSNDATSSRAGASANSQRLSGLVAPIKQVILHAPLEGVLAQVLVTEGAKVKSGDPLARIDDKVQKAMTDLAKLRAENDSQIRLKKLALFETQTINLI